MGVFWMFKSNFHQMEQLTMRFTADQLVSVGQKLVIDEEEREREINESKQ